MSDENRFSLLQLEKDVLKYVDYRKKYKYFESKFAESNEIEDIEMNKEIRDYWYNKYINKMAYLERTYRRTNVYTNYHRNLENQNQSQTQNYDFNNLPLAPTHDPLPTAPPIAEVVSVTNLDENPEMLPILDAMLVPE